MRVRVLAAAALLLALSALSAGTAGAGSGSLHARLAGTFHLPGVDSTSSTAMVVELATGRVVFARNADLSLEPASNEKLAVTYASLVELGPAYRWPTAVLGEGHFGRETIDVAELARRRDDVAAWRRRLDAYVATLPADGLAYKDLFGSASPDVVFSFSGSGSPKAISLPLTNFSIPML